MKRSLGCFVLALVALPTPPSPAREITSSVPRVRRASEGKTTVMRIVVAPDNQYYSEGVLGGTPAMNLAQVSFASSIHADAIVYEGDNYNNTGDVRDQKNVPAWVAALQGADIPWISPPGNHDYDDHPDGSGKVSDARTLTSWNANVGSKMGSHGSVKGTYPNGSYANAWMDIGTHGGSSWGVISLEFCPRDEALAWANQVVTANPAYKFIVTTHNYLTDAGTLDDASHETLASCHNEGFTSDYNPGQGIWEKLVKDHDDQIRLVLSGHWNPEHGFSAHRVDLGGGGHNVHSLFFDPQTVSNGNYGFLRVLTFYSDDSADVMTYSPVTAKYMVDRENQFSMNFGPVS